MSTLHPCEPVGLDFLDHAPAVFRNSVDLAVTPDQVFEVLADAGSWPHWATVITRVTWTSPRPHGVGTTRTVDMRGGIVGEERFLAWEPGHRMAFRFESCSTSSLEAFVEDYRIEAAPGGSVLTWTLANRLGGIARRTSFASAPIMDLMFRRFLSNLRRYTDERFAPQRA